MKVLSKLKKCSVEEWSGMRRTKVTACAQYKNVAETMGTKMVPVGKISSKNQYAREVWLLSLGVSNACQAWLGCKNHLVFLIFPSFERRKEMWEIEGGWLLKWEFLVQNKCLPHSLLGSIKSYPLFTSVCHVNCLKYLTRSCESKQM